MKKVSIEQNLGRKSKCRYPRIPNLPFVFKAILPSTLAKATPPFSQTLTLAGMDTKEFYIKFNDLTLSFLPGFLASFLILYNHSNKTYDIFFRSPKVLDMLFYLLGLNSLRKLRPVDNLVILDSSFLISLSQLLEFPSYFISLILNHVKQIGGHLNSCEYKKEKYHSSLWAPYLIQKYRSPLPQSKKSKKKKFQAPPQELSQEEKEKRDEKERKFFEESFNRILPREKEVHPR